jgi:hypothetical protein
MSSNRLSGPIPTTFANLVNITRINLHSNLLTGTLQPFVSLRTMDYLNVGDNRISGEFCCRAEELWPQNLRHPPRPFLSS